MLPDYTAILAQQALTAAEAGPEGVTFHIVAGDEATARRVAPMLADVLRPERVWGSALHAEACEDGCWDVVVRDMGPLRPPTT